MGGTKSVQWLCQAIHNIIISFDENRKPIPTPPSLLELVYKHSSSVSLLQNHPCRNFELVFFIDYLVRHYRVYINHDLYAALFSMIEQLWKKGDNVMYMDLMALILQSEIYRYGYSQIKYIHPTLIPLLLNYNINPHQLTSCTYNSTDLLYVRGRILRQRCIETIFGRNHWMTKILCPMISYEELIIFVKPYKYGIWEGYWEGYYYHEDPGGYVLS
jgi:hypothetical protein